MTATPGTAKQALIVSTASPHPVVTNGCARLVSDYERRVFPGHDMWFLAVEPGTWTPAVLFHGDEPVDARVHVDTLISRGFEFALFIGFGDNGFTRSLATALPSFCLTDAFPHPAVPDDLFRGVLSHRFDGAAGATTDVILVGGSYDDHVFRPARRDEDIVLSVGRVHPDKGQLDLVASYREQVFEPFGLPLHLVGGVDDDGYYKEVDRFIDGVSVVSSIDPNQPSAPCSWRSAEDIAALCNRARLFVSGSPRESFGMALVEAMACGTTCVVNGEYTGFAEADLRPHVHGHIAGRQGSTVEVTAKALADDIRIDASGWAAQYSLSNMRPLVAQFVDERL